MRTAPATRAAEPRAVEPGHPRIFFTAKDLPALRNRIQTTHAGQWRGMKKWADGNMAGKWNHTRVRVYLPTYAFLYRLGGEKAYADKAIAMARELLAAVTPENVAEEPVWFWARSLAMCYDWCHDRLTASDKAAILKGIDEIGGPLYERLIVRRWFGGLNNHGNNNLTTLTIMGLAMHGEHPHAAKYLDAALSAYTQDLIPAIRHFGGPGDGMWHEGMEYTRHALIPTFLFLAACRSALNEDLYAPEFEQFAYGLLYGTYPDNTMLREGDNHFPAVTEWERKYMGMIAARYRNPHAQWYVNHMTKPTGGADAWFDILWYDPSVPETPPDALPLARCFESFGMAVMRTGWHELDAAVVTFKCADYFEGHDHCNQNSFTIYRKGHLALDAGGYDRFSSAHWQNYYSRTVAHNTVTVFDAAEDGAANFGGKVNDGGQIVLKTRNGKPNSPQTIKQALGDPQYDTGDIVVFEQAPGYVRVLGDATRAYSAHKLKQFTRELVVLHPKNKTNPPAIVVFDRVSSTRPDYAKKWLLHTAEKPEQVGPGTWRATE
ncbi:MAG: heparinase II/III family protein, partial [Kiritimatiellae bacterium]|nr:heparinase II/III family protein [Kiritimatiellia bacterium]